MRFTMALAVFCAAGTPCVAQLTGCGEVDPPSLRTVQRRVTYLLSSGAATVAAWQATAWAQGAGDIKCSDMRLGFDNATYHYRDFGAIFVVSSGGEGEVDTSVAPGLAGVSAAGSNSGDRTTINRGGGSEQFGQPPNQPHSHDFLVYLADASAAAFFDSNCGSCPRTLEISMLGPWSADMYYIPSSGPTVYYWGFGGGVAATSAPVEFDVTSAAVFDIEDRITIDIGANPQQHRGIVSALFKNGGTTTSHPIVLSGNGNLLPGWTSQGGGAYSRTITPSASVGSREFGTTTVLADDQGLDANCDGRFTAADVAVVTGWISTDLTMVGASTNGLCPREVNGDPNALAKKFDYDNDDEITSADVAILQAIYDGLDGIGQASGVFGDTDGDGDRDCDDVVTIADFDDYVITDTEYNVRLDFNLDGILDASDFAEYESSRATADLDDDGTYPATPDSAVDINDLLYFLLAFGDGDPTADIDNGSATGVPDGGVNIDDYLYFLTLHSEGC